ncbi:MAG: hypothetical protein MI975_18135 [Cytophagales bacterium]|nr:hypothetical protein [Cytophagales bacterium]
MSIFILFRITPILVGTLISRTCLSRWESNNLAKQHPKTVEELLKEAEKARNELGDFGVKGKGTPASRNGRQSNGAFNKLIS